jgi:hypothetical protein
MSCSRLAGWSNISLALTSPFMSPVSFLDRLATSFHLGRAD